MCEVMRKYEEIARQEGIAEGIIAAAVGMLDNGIAPELVAKCCGLPLSKVLQLIKN